MDQATFRRRGIGAALSEEARPVPSASSLRVRKRCSSRQLAQSHLGRAGWTMELLADEMVRLTKHETLSSETVRRRLAKEAEAVAEENVCIPSQHRVRRAMEDVLDSLPEHPTRSAGVCFDETPRQLIGRRASQSRRSRERRRTSTTNTCERDGERFMFSMPTANGGTPSDRPASQRRLRNLHARPR